MGTRVWEILTPRPLDAEEIAKKYGVSLLAAEILAARGYDAETAEGFLGASNAIHDPFLLKDMDRAVAVISQAIEDGEKIAVFGDYDCDGIAATAILFSYLGQVGADACYYIPNREQEGYGLNKKAVEELKRLGVSLIVTVDNGVSAIEEVDYANSLGVKVVITDHHQPREVLPAAQAIVNPHRADCPYPFKALAGAGVAFKLVSALEGDLGYETLEYYADYLAIGTVADVVELTGENRYFAARGVEAIKETLHPGLRALLESAGVEPASVSSESIAFGIAPRLNAAGRIDSADYAVMLLLTESEEEAKELAARLEGYNQSRRQLEKRVNDDIGAMIAGDPSLALRRVMVLSGAEWNAGIVGIVCSRMVERYGRPCLIVAEEEGESKGSGRSVEGFSLIDAVAASSERLTRFGGHPMAAGFSVLSEDIGDFAARIESYAKELYPIMPPLKLKIDLAVEPGRLSLEEVKKLSSLEPFGNGNEVPVLAVRGARVEQFYPLSEGKHLRIRFSKDGGEFSMVYFFARAELLDVRVGDEADVAFTASTNVYRGEERVSLKVKAVRLSRENSAALHEGRQRYEQYARGELRSPEIAPDREDLAWIYRYLKRFSELPLHYDAIFLHMPEREGLTFEKFRIALDVMLELSLLTAARRDGVPYLSVNRGSPKVDLESSTILRSLREQYV